MPAYESMVHSLGVAPTYQMLDGRTVEVRSGCLVDQATRRAFTKSSETAAVLLRDALLTARQREEIEEWGQATFESSSITGMGQFGITHNKFG